MLDIINAISSVMFSSGPLQWAGAFFWGIASVILSPCGIAAIPLVVGYIENTDSPSRWEAFKISCAFCSGIVLNLMLDYHILRRFFFTWKNYIANQKIVLHAIS